MCAESALDGHAPSGPNGDALVREIQRSIPPLQGDASQDENAIHVPAWRELVQTLPDLGPSSCGATAVCLILRLLERPVQDEQSLSTAVGVHLRNQSGPLADYLQSRSCAGTTASELQEAVERLSGGAVRGRFFPTNGTKKKDLTSFLIKWIGAGAVALATHNPQRVAEAGKGADIPDAWHHEIVVEAGPNGIRFAGQERWLCPRYVHRVLNSPRILLVRAADVKAFWDGNLEALLTIPSGGYEPSWQALNVAGQVGAVMRDSSITHIQVPAAYQTGLTLFAPRETGVFSAIEKAAEL